MKILPLFLLLCTSLFASINPPKLEVTVENIKKVIGTIEVGVYDSSDFFLDKGKEFIAVSKNVTGKKVTFTINLPKEGEYALAVYQDVNGNKKCNTNFLGIPKEPYGFSNVFKTIFSKPKFKNCKINTKNTNRIVVKLLK